MESLVEDTLTLARQGAAIDDFEWVSLESVAEEAWSGVDTVDGVG